MIVRTITCIRCNKETPVRPRANTQKYCPECSEIRDLERKLQWAKDNKDSRKVLSEEERNIKRRKDKDTGRVINGELRKSIVDWVTDSDEEVSETDRLVRISVPFTYAASKNAIWSLTRKGHVYLREDHKSLRNEIGFKLKQALQGERFYEDKIWLDIYVQKPNHKGDAVNVLDTVCDAVKEVLGVDDRWYSIKRIDWQIVKDNPKLFIGISQKSDGDKRICSYCGRIMPLDMFWKDKADRMGVGRECKECKTAKGRKKKSTDGGYDR